MHKAGRKKQSVCNGGVDRFRVATDNKAIDQNVAVLSLGVVETRGSPDMSDTGHLSRLNTISNRDEYGMAGFDIRCRDQIIVHVDKMGGSKLQSRACGSGNFYVKLIPLRVLSVGESKHRGKSV